MDKDYYRQYYVYERSHWWFRVRSRIIESKIRHLGNRKGLRILNIGVATGASSEMLSKYGEVISVEYDKDCFEFVSGILPGKVVNASITELPFDDNSFDLVCAFDVIEHVEDHKKAVEEMNRVCKPDGLVYVTVPAYMSLWSNHDVINHHVRRYTRPELRQLFHHIKAREEFATYFNSLLFPPIYLFRRMKSLFRKKEEPLKAQSDFEVIRTQSFLGKIMNSVLGAVFSMELFFLKFMRFPAGVSILILARKTK